MRLHLHTTNLPQHIFLTIRNDEELGGLLPCGIITRDGILPNITRVLQPKKTVKKTSSSGGKGGQVAEEGGQIPQEGLAGGLRSDV